MVIFFFSLPSFGCYLLKSWKLAYDSWRWCNDTNVKYFFSKWEHLHIDCNVVQCLQSGPEVVISTEDHLLQGHKRTLLFSVHGKPTQWHYSMVQEAKGKAHKWHKCCIIVINRQAMRKQFSIKPENMCET